MECMSARQPLHTILAALLPDNVVRCVWKPNGEPSTSQITGTVLGTTAELLRIFPLQGHGRQPKSIHLDRVHSVVVIREGEAALLARARAADSLRRAAFFIQNGDTSKAREHVLSAETAHPGLVPTLLRED